MSTGNLSERCTRSRAYCPFGTPETCRWQIKSWPPWKSIAFIKWLGIAIPNETEQAIVTAPAPLSKSIDICTANLRQILNSVDVDLPLGVNAESVSINRDEIDASIDLFLALSEIVQSWSDRRYDATA